jgi:hypothetical protein
MPSRLVDDDSDECKGWRMMDDGCWRMEDGGERGGGRSAVQCSACACMDRTWLTWFRERVQCRLGAARRQGLALSGLACIFN